MARHKVEICGVNTANIKVLSNEEMTVLFERLKEGDPFAKDDLVNGNLKLVLSILRKYNNRTDNMDDLFQVGCIGLIKAIDNFDLSHDVKFSTYAVPMILGEIKRYLRDNNSIRISRSIKDTAYRALKLKEELTNQNGKEPTVAELAKLLELPEYDVSIALDSLKDAISKLKEKERYILTERYIIGKTQMELANEIGISQAQISRLEKSGLDNLKKMIQ